MRELSGDRQRRSAQWLRFLLRLSGVILLFAFPSALLPTSWMAVTHRWLGLGEFPASSLVEYLTRSVALLYGIHGGLELLISFDTIRYAPIIAYLGWMHLFFGVSMLAIDINAGLPWYWTVGEGPPLIVLGVLLLWLVRQQGRRNPA